MIQIIGNWFNHFKLRFSNKFRIRKYIIFTDKENKGICKDIYFIIENKYENIEIKDVSLYIKSTIGGGTITKKAKSYYIRGNTILIKFHFDENFFHKMFNIKSLTFKTSIGNITKGVRNASCHYRESQV
jgi:hypothetical protein